jgi:hypothetical protein
MTYAYTVWHLNLSFSSLEVSQRKDIINKCYWPILKLAEKDDFSFGLEATASTLEMILEIDPYWVQSLKQLIAVGKIEFIGSGWAQVIGPLVPALVTQKNIRLGAETYAAILGKIPKTYLLNEQVSSPGLIELYKSEGIQALVMEWENPFSANPQWDRNLRFHPQLGMGITKSIPVIWNHSIAFQKLQKMAHGDISLEEWGAWFSHEISSQKELGICIYGGDAETFDFRTNRFETEGAASMGEWERIESAFYFAVSKGATFILPSKLLEKFPITEMANLQLSNAAMPLPTKKQAKYNPLRWAVGGRDAFRANTICEQILVSFKQNTDGVTDLDWRKLLDLWGSDYRTHITESRWDSWNASAQTMLDKYKVSQEQETPNEVNYFEFIETDGYLTVSSESMRCVLNTKRGLAIDTLCFFGLSDSPLVGTIRHGDLHHIEWNADFYSGEFVVDLPGEHKITDLQRVTPTISRSNFDVTISALIETKLGSITKTVIFSGGDEPKLTMKYHVNWDKIPPCTMRFGDIVLVPGSFDRSTLFVETHNGGLQRDRFTLDSVEADHGKYWSPLISARNCFGMTEGELIIGDRSKAILVTVEKSLSSIPALLTNVHVIDSYFTRIQFTARELDDTSTNREISLGLDGRSFAISIQPFTMS